MPEITFASKDAIPEGLREFAAEKDGKWSVAVAPAQKFNEFRDNNIKYLQERDTATAALGTYKQTFGDDPAKAADELRALREINQQVKDGKLKASGDIAAQVDERTKAAREQYEAQLRESGTREQTLAKERDSYRDKYRASVRDSSISAAVMAADSGINPAALADVMRRAADVFVVEDDGKLVAKKDNAVIYSADGSGGSMGVKEWLGKLLKEAPYLGKASAGGGGGSNGEMRGGMSKEKFDTLSPTDRLNAHWNNQK